MKQFKRLLCSLLILGQVMWGIDISSLQVYAATKAEIQQVQVAKEKSEFIIKYKDKTGKEAKLEAARKKLGLKEMSEIKALNGFSVIKVDATADTAKVITELTKDTAIDYIQPNYRLFASAEPRYTEQWGLENTGNTSINVPAAWALTKGDPGVLVGVLDTGIDINHEDLAANIYVNAGEIPANGVDDDGNGYIDDVNGWDFYNKDASVYDGIAYDTHGTHVSGIIAAEQNEKGISGVAPKVKLLPLKFIHDGAGYTSDALEAISYAGKSGVKIINCSFGGPDNNKALRDSMEAADILFICASGNGGLNIDQSPVYPAAFELDNVIAVTAINNSGSIPTYANFGTRVELAAPGDSILSTVPDNGYGLMSGTSMAAPFVAGTAALIKSKFPGLTNREVANRIKTTGTKIATLNGKTLAGTTLEANNALAGEVAVAPTQPTAPVADTPVKTGNSAVKAFAATIPAYLQDAIHFGQNGVNPAVGNYSTSETDMSLTVPGFTLNIKRTYNSKNTDIGLMGKGWTFGFESTLKADTSNAALYTAKLPDGSVEVFELASGVYTAYDSHSTLVKSGSEHTLTTKDQYQYHFNSAGRLDYMADRNGNKITIIMDGAGKVTSIKDPAGRTVTVAYNASGKIEKITDPMGRFVTYGYNGDGQLNSVTDPLAKARTYVYVSGLLKTISRKGSAETLETIIYTGDKVLTYTDVNGNAMSYTYDTANRITTIADTGRTIQKYYDAQNYVTKTVVKTPTDTVGVTTQVEYLKDSGGVNRYGEESSITDRNGAVTSYVRDTRGNITQITNPDGGISTYVYDTKNNLVKETDEDGFATWYVYDAAKLKLLKEVTALSGAAYAYKDDANLFAVKQYFYGDQGAVKGLLKKTISPDNTVETYEYDAYGNRTKVIDGFGNAHTYTYNVIGWVTTHTTPKGFVTTYVYDNGGNLTEEVQPGGGKIDRLYTPDGFLTKETAPNGNPTTYSHNKAGKVTHRSTADRAMTEYVYDAYGNCTTEIRANGSRVVRTFDGINRQTSEKFNTGAGADIIQFYLSYSTTSDKQTLITKTRAITTGITAVTLTTTDFRGNVVEVKNPDGGTKTITYNKNGTIQSQTDFAGKTDTYTYTFNGNLAAKWENAGSALRYTAFEYTNGGKVKREIRGKDSVGLWVVPAYDRQAVLTHTYDAVGNRIETTDKENRKNQFAYDAEGNCTYKLIHTGTATVQEESYVYNFRGQVTEQSRTVLGKDLNEQGLAPDGKVALTTRNSYDKNGNLTKVVSPNGSAITTEYDNMNRPTIIKTMNTDEDDNRTEIKTEKTYDNMGNLATEKDPRGNITTYAYTKRGQLETTTQTNGAETLVTLKVYNAAGRMVAQILPKNNTGAAWNTMSRTLYTYDTMDRVITVREIDVANSLDFVSKAYAYDGNGNIIKELDGEGFKSGAGTSEAEKIATGSGIRTTYNGFGEVTSSIDARGYTTRFEYDGMGRKIQVVLPDGSITVYGYNDHGDLIKEAKRANSGDSEKVQAIHTYDLAGNRILTTDGNGNKTTYENNGLGQVRKVTYSSDATVAPYSQTFVYDRNGRKATVSDSMGKISTTDYDSLDRVLAVAVRGPNGKTGSQTRYDLAGNVRYQIDGNGNQTEFQYDSLNRKIKAITHTKGVNNVVTDHTVEYVYDKNSNVAEEKTTKVQGSATYTSSVKNTYDALNRLKTVEDGNGIIIKTLTYDNAHRQIVSKDGENNETKFEYDRSGNLTKTIYAAESGQVAKTETKLYDGQNRVMTVIDGMGGGTGYTYDPIGGKIKVSTNAMGEQTLCGYDVMGNLISQTDGNGNTLFFEYNSRNLPIKRIDAGGRTGEEGSYQYDLKKVESYTYYPDGTLKETKDRNGVTTTTAWDIRGNQTGKSAESLTVTNTYDAAGNKTGMQDITGKTSRAYDGLNRVIIKAVPKVGTNAYLYDVPTELTGGGYGLAEITKDAMGKETKRIFDKAGRLVEVIDSDSEKTTYEYYNTGAQKSVTYPGGAKEEYQYYPNGQLKQLTNTAGGHSDIYLSEYDAAGRLTKKTEPRGITTYVYDRCGRLSKVEEPNEISTNGRRIIEYTYDKAGNRLRQVTKDNASIKSLMYEYNEQNRLMRTVENEVNGVTQSTEYFYDNNGNQLYFKKEQVTKLDPMAPLPNARFSAFVLGQTTELQNPMVAWVGSNKYNAFNELIATKGAGGSIESSYNGEGYRTVKVANGVTTYGLYEGDKLVLETDSSGKEKVRTTYGLNAINRTDNGDKVFYLYNPHADVVNLVSGSSVVATYAYDAFGNPVASGEWAGIDDDKKAGIRYAGYQYDSESGYYYLNARMYDPKTARFLQEDSYRGSLADPLSLNLYTYCSNSPVNYCDPTGHWQQGDEKLKESTRIQISRLTDAYHAAKTDTEKKAIHDKAENLRNVEDNKGNGNEKGSTGSNFDKAMDKARKQGRNYVVASDWNNISTTKDDVIVKKVIKDGKITADEINKIAGSKPTEKVAPKPVITTGNSGAWLPGIGYSDSKEGQLLDNQIYNTPSNYLITGDKQVDNALNRFNTTQPQFSYGEDPMYGQARVTYQSLLLRMDSKGIDVSKLSVKQLRDLFEVEMDYQRDATMFLAGVGEVKVMSGGKVVIEKAVNACFIAGTLVVTEKGMIQIENIKTGDRVWSEDPKTGEVRLKKVVNTFVHEKSTLLIVEVDGRKIETTEEHPFWVEGSGWVLAGNLKNGDILRLKTGANAKVTSLELVKLEKPVKVYNFEVEVWHTYFVSESCVLVHNKAMPYKDVVFDDLRALTKSEIRELGGEAETSILKKNVGKSRADLYVDPDTGNVYAVNKRTKVISDWVDTIDIK